MVDFFAYFSEISNNCSFYTNIYIIDTKTYMSIDFCRKLWKNIEKTGGMLYEDEKFFEKDYRGRRFELPCVRVGCHECKLCMCMGLSSAGISGCSK